MDAEVYATEVEIAMHSLFKELTSTGEAGDARLVLQILSAIRDAHVMAKKAKPHES